MQQINSNRKIESVQARVLLLVAGLLLLFGFSSHALAAKPVCGNFVCEGNEARTCPADCDAPPPPPPPPPTGTESCGCGTGLSGSQAAAGRRYFRELVVGSNPVTKYEVRLPSNYDVSKTGGHPVLLYLHGWGGNERSLPAPFARHGKNHGYLIVTPRGYGDGGNNSWNGFRSARLNECPVGHTAQDCNAGPAQSPSTCVDIDGAQHNYCYDSCKDNNGECPKWDGANGNSNTFGASFDGDYTCYWTTCLDSVAQIEALLNELESLYCIDRSMVWVSGCSNGGMFVYELAKDSRTSARFAGYLPQVGAPHPGFSQSPTAEVTPPRYFMGFWGQSDETVPGMANFPELFGTDVALDTNFNGWLYRTARSITTEWANMNSTTTEIPAPSYYDANAYSSSLDCSAWQGESVGDAEIVECFFQGGHSCPGFGDMPKMMWDFAESHPNTGVPAAVCP